MSELGGDKEPRGEGGKVEGRALPLRPPGSSVPAATISSGDRTSEPVGSARAILFHHQTLYIKKVLLKDMK